MIVPLQSGSQSPSHSCGVTLPVSDVQVVSCARVRRPLVRSVDSRPQVKGDPDTPGGSDGNGNRPESRENPTGNRARRGMRRSGDEMLLTHGPVG